MEEQNNKFGFQKWKTSAAEAENKIFFFSLSSQVPFAVKLHAGCNSRLKEMIISDRFDTESHRLLGNPSVRSEPSTESAPLSVDFKDKTFVC